MESNNFRSSSVLSDLNTNIQDDAVSPSSPLSVSKSLKSSSSSSDNEIAEFDDQENKPPGSVESYNSSTSNDGFKFKKPLSRETISNEDSTLNSLIDGLSDLKLGSTSVVEKRFSFSKWTTPLKKNTRSSNENPAFSGCASSEKHGPSSALNEETVENTSVSFLSNKYDKETSISHNDDECSEYYDCSDDENATGEQARVSTADSSFHSVPEKEHLAAPSIGDSTFVIDDTESVNRTSLAEIDRTQGDDQAYILEKYLDEQDFKLQFSMSDVSFNAITGGIDFELGKRQSICSQMETPVTGSLFSFEHQEKTVSCSTEHQDVNDDVTIEPEQFNRVDLFAIENAPHKEKALFNLLNDVENETRSLFDTNPDENIFALGRLSQAGYLHMNTVEEEDALMQLSTRKSVLLQYMQSCDNDLKQNDASESQENDPTQVEDQVEVKDENSEPNDNEITSDSSLPSYPEQTNSVVIQPSIDIETSEENSNANTNETIEIEQTPAIEDSLVKNNQSSFDKLNRTTILEEITTIDEIFTAMNKNSEKLPEAVNFFKKTSNPSSLNATIDTESIYDDSLSEKSNIIVDSESAQDIIECDHEQSKDLPKLNQSANLDASQNFNLEIEEQASFYQISDVTVNLEKTQTIGGDLFEQSQHTLKSGLNVDSKINQTRFYETEVENSTNVQGCDDNSELDQDSSKLNLTSSVLVTTNIDEEISEVCSNQEKCDEFINSSSIPEILKSFTEQFLESFENLTVSSETLEVTEEKSPDRKQLSDTASFDGLPETVKKLRQQCQELLVNRTVTFETIELTQETINEKSPNSEISIESPDSETSINSVINLAEQSQVSSVNMVAFSEKTDESVNEKGSNEEHSNELGNSDSIGNSVEQASQLTVGIDERINKSNDEKSNQYANSKSTSLINEDLHILNNTPFKLIRTVSFNLDITRIINNELTEDQDDTENEKTFDLGTTQETNQNQESLESSQAEVSEVTRVDKTEIGDVTKPCDLNLTCEWKIEETPQDIFTLVQTSLEQNEAVNLNSTHVIGESIAKDPDNLNDTFEVERKSIQDTSVIIPESSHLGNTVDVGVTQAFVEKPNDSTDLCQKEIMATVLIQKSLLLNDTVDMEITPTIEENSIDSTDLDQQNRTIDLKTSTATKVDSRVLIQEQSRLNETVDMEVTRIIEENPEHFVDYDHTKPGQSKLNETVDLKKSSPTYESTISYTCEAVALEFDTDAHMKMEGNVTVMPIFSTESILKSSSGPLNITSDDLTSETNQNDDLSNVDMEIEVNEEPTAASSNLPDNKTPEELELSYCSNSKSCDNTVIIHNSPVQRCNSPARFDKYAASMPDPGSPIPPNSPIELSNKWQTQVDLSTVADNLECLTGQDLASNSSDEMDVTDPVDSNVAPEMLQMSKQPPGLNRSISNLESIPELNETDANDEKNTSQVNTCSEKLSSTLTQTSPVPKTDSGFNESTAATARKNLDDSIFKTPIASKLPARSDLSALNDSNFNADYCARSASAKSTQSRHSLVSPRLSCFKTSPIYSPFITPSRKHRQATPRTLGDVPPSLLDMSIGCFENYTANQAGTSTIPENELNKTVDVDDEPRPEETKLLCIDDPSRKVNVKTQTHDTELSELREENATLKENMRTMAEDMKAMADREAKLKNTLHALIHNEDELKKGFQQLEDNNRILNNRYEALKECSNVLLARRNAELEEFENKVRILEAQIQEYTKKPTASSK